MGICFSKSTLKSSESQKSEEKNKSKLLHLNYGVQFKAVSHRGYINKSCSKCFLLLLFYSKNYFLFYSEIYIFLIHFIYELAIF